MKKQLKVIDYLNSGKSLNDLLEQHFVDSNVGKDGKFSLNYDQIKASNLDEIANECRGLIVRVENNKYVPVAIPFYRFFNYGQGAASISSVEEILNSTIYEKLDGTLGILHYDHFTNEWNVATRSVCDASIANGFNKTFRQIFEICLKDISFDDFTSKCEKHITYMFEILSPWNQVVVLHEEPKLILLGARNNITLEEYDINCIDLPVEKPNTYKFSTWQELSDYLESRPASIAEGFVVMTKDFKRVKIKSLNYVNAHRISSNVGSSERNMLEAILNNCEDDLEPIIPKYIFEELMVMKSKYIVIMNSILLAYEDVIKNTDSSNKKEVALYINSKYEKQKHFLFSIIKNGSYDAFIKSAKKDGGFTKSFLDSFLEQF